MSLFIDMHTLDGPVGLDDVAKAHQADLGAQAKYGVNYLRYWVDEEHGKVFCLVEAPEPTPRRPCTARHTGSPPNTSTQWPRASDPARQGPAPARGRVTQSHRLTGPAGQAVREPSFSARRS